MTTMSPRAAYITTKIVVFLLAAALTWPLSRMVGPRAWWGLGVFGLLLAAMTGVVFLASGRGGSVQQLDDADDDLHDGPDPEDPVDLPVEDFIDLHPFAPRDIPDVVRDYIDAAHAAGFREVRVIHGKGIGVQRERTRSVLSKHPLVESFSDGTADRGTWGATIAYLSDDN